MDLNTTIFPFNNSVETGLRTLCLLTALFPRSFDLETLVCLDYLCVHAGDFDAKVKSLHPENPNRQGELFVRRAVIEDGIEVFLNKGLIINLYLNAGIEYRATELAASFLDSLTASYSLDLVSRSEWVNKKVQDQDKDQIQALVKSITANYAFQILHQ